MKVKIYINDSTFYDEQFPRVLTEKQYQEKLQELVKTRMDNLKHDDGFEDYIASDYHINEVFFLTEEEKAKMVKNFEPYAVDNARDEMEDYYNEYEIEI